MHAVNNPIIHPGSPLAHESGAADISRRPGPGSPAPCSSPAGPETAGGTHTCCGNCPDCTCRSTTAGTQSRAV